MSTKESIYDAGNPEVAKGRIQDLWTSLDSVVGQTTTSDAKYGQLLASTESMSEALQTTVQTASATLKKDLSTAFVTASVENYTSAQLDAANRSGMLGTNPTSFFGTPIRQSSVTDEKYIINQGSGFDIKRLAPSKESYNEEDIRNLRKASIAYNFMALSQNAFAKTFFPPIVMDSTTNGLEIVASMAVLHNEVVRNTSGELADFGRTNPLRGFVDPSVFLNRTTEVIPVWRPTGPGNNAKVFVPETLVPRRIENLGVGIDVVTGPLALDEPFDLAGVSQRNEIVNAGIMDSTDTLSEVMSIKNIYVQIGADVYCLNTKNTIGANWVSTQEGDTRMMNLKLVTRSFTIKSGKKTVLDAAPTESVNFFDKIISISFALNGESYLDSGDTVVRGSSLKLTSASKEDGTPLDATDFDTLAKQVATGKVIGFDLDAVFENLNLRMNGQLVETKSFIYLARVPYKSPLSTFTSTYHQGAGSESSLAELVSYTNARADNEAVAKVFEVADVLRNYVPLPDKNGIQPTLGCIGALYVKPKFTEETIDLRDITASTRSGEAFTDIRAGLLGRIHTNIMALLIGSEYIPTGAKLTGNAKFKPKAILATDPQIAAYLIDLNDGDEIKTSQYDLTICSSVHQDMIGKIVISFSNMENAEANKVNVLNFAHYIHSPELVSLKDKTMNGAMSTVFTVTPRWLHFWVLPIMGLIHVEGVSEISMKISLLVENKKP